MPQQNNWEWCLQTTNKKINDIKPVKLEYEIASISVIVLERWTPASVKSVLSWSRSHNRVRTASRMSSERVRAVSVSQANWLYCQVSWLWYVASYCSQALFIPIISISSTIIRNWHQTQEFHKASLIKLNIQVCVHIGFFYILCEFDLNPSEHF